MKEEFQKLGIIFTDTDSALKEYPDLFKQYFAKLVPPTDNKLVSLNSAVWSGGTFIYVPKGVKVDIPLQTYFRINNENTGQFERTLIIVDEGASVHYVEGCTAPTYSSNSLHVTIVEIFALMELICVIRLSKTGLITSITWLQNAKAQKMRRLSGLMETWVLKQP